MNRRRSWCVGIAAALTLPAAISVLGAQTDVRVRELTSGTARSDNSFGLVMSVRELPNGSLIVNDGGRRQLLLLDGTLRRTAVLLDSAAGAPDSYGPVASSMISYVGDTTLFVEGASSTLLRISPSGKIVGPVAAPVPTDIRFLAGAPSGSDAQGNLLYRVAPRPAPVDGSIPGAMLRSALAVPESLTIVRANFDSRSVDSIARVRNSNSQRVTSETLASKVFLTVFVNPLVAHDEWAVLSDGRIAVVRGRDYRVDVLNGDGQLINTHKIPHVPRQLSESDKASLLDSARADRDKRNAMNRARQDGFTVTAGLSDGATGRVRVRGGGDPVLTPDVKTEFVNASEIPDYWPIFRANAVKADRDGNVWILPTTSTDSRAGELVYDVVSGEGLLTSRVRLPAGRSIVGFGKGGTVYLTFRDGNTGWSIETARVSP